MAEGKESFLLYKDLINPVEEMTDEQAGILFKLILNYVNDKNPDNPKSGIVRVIWVMIKCRLKKELVKWREIRDKRVESGKMGRKTTPKEKTKQIDKKAEKAKERIANIVKDIQPEKKEILGKWLDYRKKKGKAIKVEVTLKSLVKKFNNTPIQEISEVMERSFQGQWDGLFWDSKKNSTKKETVNPRPWR